MDVRGPDGKITRFPDGTPDAKINEVMASIYSAPPAPDRSAARGFALGAMKPVDNIRSAVSQIPVVGDALEFVRTKVVGRQPTKASVAANDAARANNTRTGYQLLGNIAGTAPTLALPGGAGVQGAAGGALLSDAKDMRGLIADTAIGALGGKVGGKVVKGVGAAIAPKLSATAQRLVDKGIPLTLGQIGRAADTYGGKFVAGVEDALSSIIPGINMAREKGIAAFNRAVVDDVLQPLGVKMPANIPAGHEAVAFAKQQFTRAYDSTLARMKVTVDPSLQTALGTIVRSAKTVPGDAETTLKNIIDQFITKRAGASGEIAGDAMKSAVSQLRKKAKGLRGTAPELAALVDDVRFALLAKAGQDSGGGLGARLATIDDAYGNFVVLRNAAKGPVDGVFTPKGFNTAISVSDSSVGKGAKATGQARMQGLAKDASAVLPSSIGETGTAPRALAGALVGGAGVANPATLLPALATGAALSVPYTRAGQQALGVLFAPGVKRAAVRNAVDRAAIPLGVISPQLVQGSRK